MITIFAEGMCFSSTFSANTGSWKVSVVNNGVVSVYEGHAVNTVKVRMELEALIAAFSHIHQADQVTVCVESTAIRMATNPRDGWLKPAIKRGWKLADGKTEVQNQDLWRKLFHAMQVILPNKAEWKYDRNQLDLPQLATLRPPMVSFKPVTSGPEPLTLDDVMKVIAGFDEEEKKLIKKAVAKPRKAAVAA